ncbi:MAG: hypothetical protein JKY37_29165 [Nannocystaceae bacterium]|nr:hypothetical protein [Nannocystaceae bacterium]
MIRSWPFILVVFLACDKGDASDASKQGSDSKPVSEGNDDKPGAFTKYRLKSMSSEARMELRRLTDGVMAAAYGAESIGLGTIDGTVAAPALPASAPMTPAPGSCCKLPKGLCPVSAEAWASPEWKAVAFEMSNPHRYSYELVVKGDTFTAKAVGDLDCDGKFSTFSLSGRIEGDEIVLDKELTIVDPLE